NAALVPQPVVQRGAHARARRLRDVKRLGGEVDVVREGAGQHLAPAQAVDQQLAVVALDVQVAGDLGLFARHPLPALVHGLADGLGAAQIDVGGLDEDLPPLGQLEDAAAQHHHQRVLALDGDVLGLDAETAAGGDGQRPVDGVVAAAPAGDHLGRRVDGQV